MSRLSAPRHSDYVCPVHGPHKWYVGVRDAQHAPFNFHLGRRPRCLLPSVPVLRFEVPVPYYKYSRPPDTFTGTFIPTFASTVVFISSIALIKTSWPSTLLSLSPLLSPCLHIQLSNSLSTVSVWLHFSMLTCTFAFIKSFHFQWQSTRVSENGSGARPRSAQQ